MYDITEGWKLIVIKMMKEKYQTQNFKLQNDAINTEGEENIIDEG